jgi:hypothetical protein
MVSYTDSSGRIHIITASGVHYVGRSGGNFTRVRS